MPCNIVAVVTVVEIEYDICLILLLNDVQLSPAESEHRRAVHSHKRRVAT